MMVLKLIQMTHCINSNSIGKKRIVAQYRPTRTTTRIECPPQPIVYPPSNGSYPDFQRQKHTILKVIASFLNSDGGTLYLGVNDSGAGVGLYDDLCYEEFNGDRDKYQRYVLDSVALQWGNNVSSYVSADWDRDNTDGKDVLIVKVDPYPAGVELDGEWLYRNGSGNRRLTKEEFDDYNERRKERLASQRSTETVIYSGEENETEKPVNTTAQVPSVINPAPSINVEKVLTSVQRKNVLENWQEDYVPNEALIKFMPHGKVRRITEYDYDENTELTLPVYEEDIKDKYLILGYKEGRIAKIPVREIMQFDGRNDYIRYTGSKLLFASIASDADGLITVSEEDKAGHRQMVRVDTIANIDKCRLPDSGERVYNEGIATSVLKYEIAPADSLSHVSNILNKDARTLGFPLPSVTPDIRKWLKKWGV